MTSDDLRNYKEEYSDSKLMNKLKRFARTAGLNIVYMVLIAKEILSSEDVPFQTKVIITGSLGYFIMPLDFIPDILAVVGYTDDGAALLAALVTAAVYINDDMKRRAKQNLHLWFGEFDEEKLTVLL